jgi:carboxymethylenebutenolidase
MCDELTEQDNVNYLRESQLSRRDFNRLGMGATVAMMLPAVANAMSVAEKDILVETPDGQADCYFVHPTEGAHAAVIVWPDIMGIRTSFRMMGKRLAESGYSVLVVNPYYRSVKGPVIEDGESFSMPAVRERLMPYARSLSPETCVIDGRAFVTYLDRQPSVDTSRKIGTTGYCMTGSYTLRLAADMPERIGAAGSFHGGGLVTEAASSPHLLAPQIKAGVLIAIAENDDEKEPEAKTVLRESFERAGVRAEIEVYAGALHGWCPPDSVVYNEVQAERAWNRLLALFERELA